MTQNPSPPPPTAQPASLGYVILTLTALTGMVLVLMEDEREPILVMLLAGVGAIGVMANWRAAPPFLLLGLAVLEVYHHATLVRHFGAVDWAATGFTDVVLCAVILAYSAGQYRWVSLRRAIFPINMRRPPAGNPRRASSYVSRPLRSPHLPQPWEPLALAITAAGWAVGASLLWLVLSIMPAPLGMSWQLWRGLLLIFIVGTITALLSGAVAYLSWLTTTPAEHLIFLQDQVWRETLSEQNQINRWLTWARLRGQLRKEKT